MTKPASTKKTATASRAWPASGPSRSGGEQHLGVSEDHGERGSQRPADAGRCGRIASRMLMPGRWDAVKADAATHPTGGRAIP
jgi:hypothetical protein